MALNPFIPTNVPPYSPQNGEIDFMRRCINLRMGFLMVGPTGSGKTHAINWLAQNMARPIVTFQGHEGVTQDHVFGSRGIFEQNGVSVTRFIEGLVPLAMKMDEGAILYLDEPQLISPGILACFHSLMDHRKSICIPEDNNRVVEAKPGFVVVGAMNEGAGYGGFSLDHAFRDRFGPCIEFNYLAEEKEIDLIVARSDISAENAGFLVKIAGKLRKAFADKTNDVRTPCSTRSLLDCALLVKSGMDMIDAVKYSIVGKVPSHKIAERQAFYGFCEAVLGQKVIGE